MVVRASSGLTSRIRMIYDAYIAVKKYEKNPKLIILWESEICCNIRYEDVFENEQFSDIQIKVVEVEKKGYREGKSIRKLVKQVKILELVSEIVHRIYKKILYSFYSRGREIVRYSDAPEIISGDFTEYRKWKKDKWNKIEKLYKEHKKIYVDCYESFIVPRDTADISEVIKFKSKYISVVNKIINGNVVGIHIRGTDHELAKKLSPLELFIQKIDNEINENNSVKFFLSTDDKDVENELIRKYGQQRIIIQPNKQWGRLSKEEMVSGIVDCLCLSKCTKIYGSLSSQFSGFAAEYGKIPIEIIEKK